jgi:hypothetical protein
MDGHLFVGWFTQPEGGEEVTASTIASGENCTVYARYEKAFRYTFLNYDDTVWAEGLLAENAPIPAPTETPTRPADETCYYIFTGWEGYTADMAITEDVTFRAQFEQHEIEILPEMSTDAYVIRDGFLRAIALGTTVDSLREKLVPSEFITVTKDGTAAEGAAATGMEVVYVVNGETHQTLTVVVTGDVNGDGLCDITDMVQLRAYLLGKRELSSLSAQAADLNGDSSVDITDMVQLRAFLLGKRDIAPN